ncbi:hypothetical protein QFC24_004088 [Naganishia onofrii]|uniref:Uncharacterized protein n=1 Tax=Naganishia onofrii TaxID=1851511 RepID=A0ACC2XGB7_9TREE|nr:hypothetical protein QFC24_004088 [Naganishia onofrii]
MTSAGASAVAFSGSFVDMIMAAILSLLLAWVQLFLTARQRVVTNIFEIGTAGIIAFLARALGSTGYFCYGSLVSSAIILILPGWFICLGALELGSRNIVSGAIRSVWAIVYTLFLSFAISIGSEVYDSFGPAQPSASSTSTEGSALQTVVVQGSFSSNNTAFDNQFQNGGFGFAQV